MFDVKFSKVLQNIYFFVHQFLLLLLILSYSLVVPDSNEKHEGDLSAVAVALVIAIPSAVICIMGIIAVLWYNRYHDKKTSSMRHYVNVEANFEVNKAKKLKDIIDASMSGK